MKNFSQLSTRCQFAPNTGGCNSLTAGRGEPGGSSSTGSEHLRPQLFITSSLFNAAIVCGNVRRQCKHWWSSSRKWQVRITLAGFHGIVTVQCVELIVTIIAVGFPSITTGKLFNVKFTILHIPKYYNCHTLQYSYSQQSQHNASQISQLKCVVPSTNWASYYPKKLCSTSYYFTHSVQVASPSQSTTL